MKILYLVKLISKMCENYEESSEWETDEETPSPPKDSLKTENRELKKENQELKSENQVLKSENQELKKGNFELKNENQELKKSILEKDKDLKRLNNKFKDVFNRQQETEDTIKSLTQRPYRKTGDKSGDKKDVRYFCNVCNTGTCTVTRMGLHLQDCNPKALRFHCLQCPRKFLAEGDLSRHVTLIHRNK